MKQKCTAMVWKDYHEFRCRLGGTLEHDGKWYCKTHHPPTVKAKDDARRSKWKDDWAKQDRERAAAQREQALKDRALEWMRRENPLVLKGWEDEL